ncbi:MAG: insulinase family protein, partial [Pseudomonadota bacterium]
QAIVEGQGGSLSAGLPGQPGQGGQIPGVSGSAGAAQPEVDPWAGRSDLIEQPAPIEATETKLPPLVRFTLENGLRVLVIENHDLPLVNVHLEIEAGELDEPREKRSIASYAAAMLTMGTRSRSADEIATAMDTIGGSLGADANWETTRVFCKSLSKDQNTCIDLLADVVSRPSFPEEKLGEVKGQLLASLRQTVDDAASLVGEHFENLLWGEDHVRGWPVTTETIQAVSREDLVSWHAEKYHPASALLVIAGDVSPKRLEQRLASVFSVWKRTPAQAAAPSARKEYAEPRLSGLRVRLVDKPGQNQAQIAVGHLGIRAVDKDYLATRLVNHVLGGGSFASRLMSAIRIKSGNTYAISSTFQRSRARGSFRVRTFTRNAEVATTLRLILEQIAKMHDEGPTAEEISDSKSYVAGSQMLTVQSLATVTGMLASAERYGLGDSFVREFATRVAKIPLEEVRTASRQRLDPANVCVAIVADAGEVAPLLRAAGVPFEQVGYLEPISVRDRQAQQRQRESAAADSKLSEEGRRALDAALEAKGGAERLRALRDLTTKGKVVVGAGSRSIEGNLTRYLASGNRLRVDFELPPGSLTVVVSPEAVWQSAAGRIVDVPEPVASEERNRLWHDHDLVLLRHLDPGTVVQANGRQVVGGKEYDAVVLAQEGGRGRTRALFDPATHLLFRLEYEDGAGELSYEEYLDYRAVDGIMFPFVQHVSQKGQLVKILVTEMAVDRGVPAELFAKPRQAPSPLRGSVAK